MKKFYNISIEGYGGEVVIGKISQDQFHFWQGKDHKLVNHLFNKTKVPKKAKLEKIIWEYDDICHTSGPEYNENQIIKISRVDKNGEFIRNKKGKIIKQYSMKIKNLKKYGSKINCIEEHNSRSKSCKNDYCIFGQNFNKGVWYTEEMIVENKSEFNFKKLEIKYQNCDGFKCFNYISYNEKKYFLMEDSIGKDSKFYVFMGRNI